MSTAFWIYLYIVIGNLGWVVFVVSILAIGLCMAAVAAGIPSRQGTKKCSESIYPHERARGDELTTEAIFYNTIKKPAKYLSVAAIVFSVLASLYPSKSDLALIFGGAALVSVAQSDEAKKLPDNILRAANSFLEGVDDENQTTNN